MEKLNIFDVLSNINQKNYHYYDNLPNHLKKQFNNYLVFQWLSSTLDEFQVIYLARFVNDKINLPSSQFYKLLCSSTNSRQKFEWIYPKKATEPRTKIIADYLDCSTKVASLHDFSNDDVIEMANFLGYQQADLKNVL